MALVSCVFAASCGGAGAEGTGAVTSAQAAGSDAPDFSARDTDGATFRLSDHLGKEVILMDFWATWCTPCMDEMPHLESLYEADKAKGLLVVGVSIDGPETIADVPSFAKRHDMNFPVILDEDSRIVSLYNPKRSAPLSVLIDRKGHIVKVRESYNPGDEKFIQEDVEKALAAQ